MGLGHVLVWDEEQLRRYQERTGLGEHRAWKPIKRQEEGPPGEDTLKRRTKYGNRKTELDGITFDSKHEAEQWQMLQLRKRAGEIRDVKRQVTFVLPCGVKYIADFVVEENDGTKTVIDAKSDATRKDKVYKLKKRQMLSCMGIEIKEV